MKSKPKPRQKKEEPINLQKACEEVNDQTSDCLKRAHACLDVLGTYTEKNKVFEKKVQQCQERNNKNNKRNNMLKDRLDAVTERMNKLKKKNNEQLIQL